MSYNTKHSLYIRRHEREKEQKRDRTFIHALRKSNFIVPSDTIILHYDTLCNTSKDAFLVTIDRNAGKSKEEETCIRELERMFIAGTVVLMEMKTP